MLHSDQTRWTGRSGSFGPTHSQLAALARDIEETQRRQGETLSHIVGRLRALDASAAAPSETPTATPAKVGDEGWDAASAEALMQSYENAGDTAPASWRDRVPSFGAQQEWIGDRFHDVTQRIKRALGDLKPGGTMMLLEVRLDEFQRHIASALEDVVRRSDMAGLRLIESHVHDLGQKLEVLEQHVSRLNGIESDVRSVMEQVSDERIAKLLDYDVRFAADLEAVAVRAAEEVHARLGQHGDTERADAERHEELRSLIEVSIRDRRQAEADAASLVSGLTGRFNAQSDRYDEIKALLEQAIQEQRQSEQTAFSMLDTLQQGLVSVLDRIDTLEQHQSQAPAWSKPQEAVSAPAEDAFVQETPPFGLRRSVVPPSVPGMSAASHVSPAAHEPMPPPLPGAVPVEVPAAFGEPGRSSGALATQDDEGGSQVDRLRREFIADARRAKLKAAANRAEQVALSAEEPPKRALSGLEATRAALSQTAKDPATPKTGSGKIFGASPKLIAAALAVVVLINGSLLLLNRKSDTPRIPDVTIEHQAPASGEPELPPAGAGSDTGPRSHLQGEGTDAADLAAEPASTPADSDNEGQTITPYGIVDDVLNPPALDAEAATVAPQGTTVAKLTGHVPEAVLADVYQQQVLANLSGKLGDIAAEKSPDALLPDQAGRIAAAYSPVEIAPQSGEEGRHVSALDLPPATVGPLSLRLAAANGDASAEFEVAARLAEGKGTAQNFAEASRWYQRSASKGFAQSQYRLGTLYERGLGVARDLSRARVWYGRAAEQGNVKAMHNLAVLTAGGEQGEPDYSGAMPWFKKAAEHGLADSQYNLAVLIENGLGVKADRVTALKWYTLAAKGGDADARARRDALRAALSQKELNAVDMMVTSFSPRPAVALTNDARAAGEDWKKRARNDSNG